MALADRPYRRRTQRVAGHISYSPTVDPRPHWRRSMHSHFAVAYTAIEEQRRALAAAAMTG
jgi:hypothetical protein